MPKPLGVHIITPCALSQARGYKFDLTLVPHATILSENVYSFPVYFVSDFYGAHLKVCLEVSREPPEAELFSIGNLVFYGRKETP